MTEDYLKNITPDSLSGLIFGFEGIRHALTILNGPTGCKFYNSITVENQSTRKDDFDPLKFPEVWFFGQGRVPCTYLDKRDYVYGSEDKLTDAIKATLARTKPSILVIVNSPGAALIGDDLERIARNAVTQAGYGIDDGHLAPSNAKKVTICDEDIGHLSQKFGDFAPSNAEKVTIRNGDANTERNELPIITCQSPGYSKDVTDGYQNACIMAVEALCGQRDCSEKDSRCEASMQTSGQEACKYTGGRPVVNLLGLSIYQKYHAGDINELKRLLSLCGIDVNSALLCESTIDEIRRVPDAALNIVVDPDYGLGVAEELKSRFGTPYVSSDYGYPVGFKAMEELLQKVCEELSNLTKDRDDFDGAAPLDPEPALESIRRARARAYIQIARINSLLGLPKGVPFAVYAQPAAKRGYTAFLTEYLGMRNVSPNPENREADTETDASPDIVLGDGNTIARMKAEGRKFTGIEIALPTIGYIDVIEKTHLGADGTLFLIEQILNGLMY